MTEDRHAAQTRIDRGTASHYSFGYVGLRVFIPVTLVVRATKQDLLTVREHVHDPGGFVVPVDQELLDAGVGGYHHLAADRHHRGIGHQVAGADP